MVHSDLSADSAAQTREPELVFVYGSLMRGMANHGQMAGCRFAGRAILQGLALFDLGPFPMATASGEPTDLLHGELYQLDGAQLGALDRFEGVPRLYERLRWPLADGRRAWIYLGRPQQVRFVKRLGDGIWRGRQP